MNRFIDPDPIPTVPSPRYKVELVKDGRAHFYDVTQGDQVQRFKSVTGALAVINKPALLPWAKREALALVEEVLMKRLDGKDLARIILDKNWIQGVLQDAKKRPQEITEKAADFGSQAHAFIDLIVKGREPDAVPPEIQGPVSAFRDWWRRSGIRFLLGDTPVASIEHGYGGSLDALGYRNGRFILLDWKTSSAIWDEYALQVSAYVQGLRETFGVDCAEAVVVRFGKKLPVDFEVKEVADLKFSFQAFLAAKALKEAFDRPHFRIW